MGARRSAVDDAVRLVVEDHMTYRAAAARCGVSVGAITNRLARDRCACGEPMQPGAQRCAACRTVLRVVSDAELIERRRRGETIAVIAAEMGRTHSSVATRLTQLRNQGAGIPYKPGGAVMAEKGRAAVQRRWARTKDFASSTKPESASGLPK